MLRGSSVCRGKAPGWELSHNCEHWTRCESSLTSNFEKNLTFVSTRWRTWSWTDTSIDMTHIRGDRYYAYSSRVGEILHLFTMSVLRNRCSNILFFWVINGGIFIDIRCLPNTPRNLIALCEKKSYLLNPFGEFGYLPLSPLALVHKPQNRHQKGFFLE